MQDKKLFTTVGNIMVTYDKEKGEFVEIGRTDNEEDLKRIEEEGWVWYW